MKARVAWLVGALLLAAAAAVSLSPPASSPTQPAHAASATQPATTTTTAPPVRHWLCLDHPPRTAEDYAWVMNHHDPLWQGGDGGLNVALPDGRIAWIFGDTAFGNIGADGTLLPGWGLAHGSMLIQDGNCFDPFYGVGALKPTSVVPQPSKEELRWPGGGWVSADGTKLQVTVSRVAIDRSKAFNFRNEGTEVATFSLPSLALEGVAPLPAPSDPNATGWGSPVSDGSYAYLYSTRGFAHYVTRVPTSATELSSGAGWEYFDGVGWNPDPASIQPMVITSAPMSNPVVVKSPSGFVMSAKRAGAFSQEVSAWTSATPAGPWTPIGSIADLSYLPADRTPGGHVVTDLPGAGPLVFWVIRPERSGSAKGTGIGVAVPTQPIS